MPASSRGTRLFSCSLNANMPDYDGWPQVGERIRCERIWRSGTEAYCERAVYVVVERDKQYGCIAVAAEKMYRFARHAGGSWSRDLTKPKPEPFRVDWGARDRYFWPGWEITTGTDEFFRSLEHRGKDRDEENPPEDV